MSRILVIDDDPTVTSVLKRGLAYEGFTVDTAGTGAQGLAIARDHVPDLVILDVMLPGLDGFEVLERLRSADAEFPVMMLTARDGPADQVRGLDGERTITSSSRSPSTCSWRASGRSSAAGSRMLRRCFASPI